MHLLDSLAKLSRQDQGRTRTTLGQLADGAVNSGLRKHKVGPWVSISPSRALRVLGFEAAGEFIAVHVGQHDEAYDWGERHVPRTYDDGRLAAVLPVPAEPDQRLAVPAVPSSPARAHGSDNMDGEWLPDFESQLLAGGLPASLAAHLARYPDESALLEAIGWLAPEWQALALEAAVGGQYNEPSSEGASDLVVLADDATLQAALRLPRDKWRLFLHPKQRFAVEAAKDLHLLIRGGPGTGKTVAAAHRYARLVRQQAETQGKPVALMALDAPARLALEEMTAKLDLPSSHAMVLSAEDLPRNRAALAKQMQDFSFVIIDEGQDLPVGYVAVLLERLQNRDPLPPHTLTYDANQSLHSPVGSALERLQMHMDSVTLQYSYRSTREIIAVAKSVLDNLHRHRGRNFQHDQNIAASKDLLSAVYVTALSGPDVVIRQAGTSLVARAAEEAHRLRASFPAEDVAVIVVAQAGDGVGTLREDLIRACPADVAVLNVQAVKGLEWRSGVVVDALPAEISGEITSGRYRALSGMYVALTRFRERVVCVVSDRTSVVMDQEQQ